MTAFAGWIELRCPRCRGPLDDRSAPARLVCSACPQEYPIVLGIPDLRIGGDPYLTLDEDRAAAEALAERAPSLSFADLLRSYYEHNTRVPAAQARQFVGGVLGASARAAESLAVWQDADRAAGVSPPRSILEIGCGTAPLLVAAGTRIERGVGIDVGLRWLVLARKRLEEAGVERPLVCASVEALPFGDGVVDRVAGESILENAADPSAALAEAARVLPPGGRLWLTTPNKYSLGPDPHIGLPASGWLPEILVQLYIRRAGIIPPKRQLFGVGELRRALSRAGFARPSVQIPRIAEAQRVGLPGVVNRVVDGYHLARAMPGVRSALRAIAPTLVVAATRRPA